jgi:hypothetical protein
MPIRTHSAHAVRGKKTSSFQLLRLRELKTSQLALMAASATSPANSLRFIEYPNELQVMVNIIIIKNK